MNSIPAIAPQALGIATRHSPEFRFERPQGTAPYCLLMCFRTPAMVLTHTGLTEALPGDCFIHTAGFRLLHYSVAGATDGFRNDWFYVREDIVLRGMKVVGLPWDAVLRCGRAALFEEGIRLLMAELAASDRHSETAIESIILSMLIAVARARQGAMDRRRRNLPGAAHFERLREIRDTALASFQRPWTVESMAREACLSPERFSALYRAFFKKSPIAEIIEARMSGARRLLFYSGLSVKEVARECGFEDVYYFSRLFKRRHGVSPLEWRRTNVLPS